MAKFLLHGLWVQRSGLHLWIEQVEGHRIVLPEAVDPGTFPAAVEKILLRASFRHRLRTTLRTPKGREVALTIPSAAYGPAEAMALFDRLAFLDPLGVPEGAPRRTASAGERTSIGADLMWLLRMYLGLNRFVRGGRVVIKLAYEDNQWYPQWQLAESLEERSWVAAMMLAAPEVLTVNNRNLDEDITQTWPHWIASRLLQDLPDAKGLDRRHEFTRALLGSTPLRRGGSGLLHRLNAWKASVSTNDLQLVAIVEEPAEGDTEARSADEQLWPVRVQLASSRSSPQPVRVADLDRGTLALAEDVHREAVEVSPLLDVDNYGLLAPRARAVPGVLTDEALGQGRVGDWDVYLTTAQIVDFAQRDAARLRGAGVRVMLPKSWTVAQAHAKLKTAAHKADPAMRPSLLGMDQLLDFNWKVSLGDVELGEAEMEELIHSKSGLIKLQDRWVLADQRSVAKVAEYMRRLGARSKKALAERIEELEREIAQLRSQGDSSWRKLDRELNELRLQQAEQEAAGSGQLTAAELRELALEASADDPLEIVGTDWQSALIGGENALDLPAPEQVEVPVGVHAQLRDYQRRGLDWLYWMSRNGLGAVLADDMGLGKTLQLLSVIAVERDRDESMGPTLVVAPTSVVGNWASEAARFMPGLRVLVHHGAQRLQGDEFLRAVSSDAVVVASYGVVSRDVSLLRQVRWDHVVLDEAQHVKNATTKAARAVRALPARHRIALTGTPMENHLAELHSILDFTNPGILGTKSFFRHRFAKPIERDRDEEQAQWLRRLTAPFILRRLKTDPAVVDDLPEKNEHVVTVTMTPEQTALYQAYVEHTKQRIAEAQEGFERSGLILSSLTRIKQICNHPAHFLGDGSGVTANGQHRSGKVAELMRLLDAAVSGEERVLIFTQYRAFGEILEPYLSERLGVEIPFLHGGLSRVKRAEMVDHFQSPEGPPAMLLSLKAGGTGLNLTAASVVIHMDRWWNPAVENQATDRAYRIGQRKDVTVYKMITAGTMEESIQDILDGKSHLAGVVIGHGEGWITELSPEQLAELMSYRGGKAGGDE